MNLVEEYNYELLNKCRFVPYMLKEGYLLLKKKKKNADIILIIYRAKMFKSGAQAENM